MRASSGFTCLLALEGLIWDTACPAVASSCETVRASRPVCCSFSDGESFYGLRSVNIGLCGVIREFDGTTARAARVGSKLAAWSVHPLGRGAAGSGLVRGAAGRGCTSLLAGPALSVGAGAATCSPDCVLCLQVCRRCAAPAWCPWPCPQQP